MFVSVTAVFAQLDARQVVDDVWTLLDVVKRQALKPSAAG